MRPTELSNQCDLNGSSVESGTKSTRMVFPPAWPRWDLACGDAIRALQQMLTAPPARPRDLGHQPDIAHRYRRRNNSVLPVARRGCVERAYHSTEVADDGAEAAQGRCRIGVRWGR